MNVVGISEINSLLQQLTCLDSWKQIAFMALCCERMVPNYIRFSSETGFGNPQVLRQGMDVVWDWLESGEVPRSPEDLCALVELQAPRTEMFTSRFTSAALDAANAVAITIDAIIDHENANVVEVATIARDTVDLYVQEAANLNPNDRGFEEVILSHLLMQTEILRQLKDLQTLENLESGKEAFKLMRQSIASEKPKGSLAKW